MSSALKPRNPRGRTDASLLGGREIDEASLPAPGEKVYASAAPVTGTLPRTLDPVFDSYTYAAHVETPANGGDDVNGDGSAEKPFATFQRALDAMPRITLSGDDFGQVRFGLGDFDYKGSYSGQLPRIYCAGSFASEETVTVSAVTPVAGSATEVDIQCTATVTTAIANPGDAQLEAGFGAAYRDIFLYADVALSKPAADTVRVNANQWNAGVSDTLTLSTRGTRLTGGDQTGITFGPETMLIWTNVDVDWTEYGGFSTIGIGMADFYSCGIISPKTVLLSGAGKRLANTFQNCYINCTNDFQIQDPLGHSASWLGNVLDATQLLVFVSNGFSASRTLLLNGSSVQVKQFQSNFAPSALSLNVLGIRDCATPLYVEGPLSSMTLNGDVSIQGTCTRLAVVANGARFTRHVGTGTGACTAVPIQVTEGTAIGVSNYAFTNSTTPGEEVKVGGLAAQSFASLPNADFTGASATGSRAT